MKLAMKARGSANLIFFFFFFYSCLVLSFLTIISATAGGTGSETAAVAVPKSANSTKEKTTTTTTSSSSSSSSSPAATEELIALLAVKASLRDPHGMLSSWKASSAGNGKNRNGSSGMVQQQQCRGDWVGVKCSRDTGRIVALHLPSKGLGGTLASEIGRLHSLRCLSLHDNAIAGPIPSSISSLHRLRALYLFHNLFTGSIPPSLPPSLHSINLAHNRLSGTIPSPPPLLLADAAAAAASPLPRLQTLILSHNQLTGPIPPQLAELPYLRVMDLSHNLLDGSFPVAMASSSSSAAAAASGSVQAFFSLIALDLSHNGLTGALPDQIATEMASLVSLALNDNHFSGPIPSSLGGIANLSSLDISHNSFNGNLPPSMASLAKLTAFNCSYNNLTGEVPNKLAHSFGASSFEGNNQGLCGFSASSPCPKTAASITGESSPLAETAEDSTKKKKKAGFHVLALVFVIIGIVIAVLLAMCACSLVFLCCFGSRSDVMNSGKKASPSPWQQRGSSAMAAEEAGRQRGEGKERRKEEGGGDGDGDGDGDGESKEEDRYIGGGKLVHFEGSKMGFGSEDLLCATAEIVGKSTYGTVYKAAIIAATGTGTNTGTSTGTGTVTSTGTGTVTGTNAVTNTVTGTNAGTGEGLWNVAVKRLRDGVAVRRRREFEAGVRLLGGIGGHPNLLPLRAYYWGPNAEKLLIFDFMPRGNLATYLLQSQSHSLSHSARGPETDTPPMPMPAFTWKRRMAVAAGAARGLSHLHDHEKMVHGNLTSTNILLDEHLVPKLSDFGLSRLMTQSANSAVLASAGALGYRAPELTKMKKATPKSDVYSFGIVLLELLTGKTSASTRKQHGKASSSSSSSPMDLPDWVASLVKKNEWSHEIFDAELVRSVDDGIRPRDEDLIACLQLAMACVKISPRERPDMAEVVRRLEELGPGEEEQG